MAIVESHHQNQQVFSAKPLFLDKSLRKWLVFQLLPNRTVQARSPCQLFAEALFCSGHPLVQRPLRDVLPYP